MNLKTTFKPLFTHFAPYIIVFYAVLFNLSHMIAKRAFNTIIIFNLSKNKFHLIPRCQTNQKTGQNARQEKRERRQSEKG